MGEMWDWSIMRAVFDFGPMRSIGEEHTSDGSLTRISYTNGVAYLGTPHDDGWPALIIQDGRYPHKGVLEAIELLHEPADEQPHTRMYADVEPVTAYI